MIRVWVLANGKKSLWEEVDEITPRYRRITKEIVRRYFGWKEAGWCERGGDVYVYDLGKIKEFLALKGVRV